MTKRSRTVPIVAALCVAASCAGDSDDASDTANTTGTVPARIEVVRAAPPDTAAVSDVVDTIPVLDEPPEPPNTEADLGDVGIAIVGSETDDAAVAAFNAALDVYEESVGTEITYIGTVDFASEVDVLVSSGAPPDIAIFPQPPTLLDLARDGVIPPVTDEVVSATRAAWPADVVDLSVDDAGVQYGVPVSVEMKSLVWHVPDAFVAIGESVPETWREFEALVERTAAGGITPLCVGIESGAATGWVFTDWVEDLVLREHGTEVYDQWVDHDIPFDDPRIVESMQRVLDLWSGDRVFASAGTIAETSFSDNADPLVTGECLMHRQGSFFETFFPSGVAFADGSAEAVDVFDLPADDGRPAVIWANVAAAFDDRPEVSAVLQHLSSASFADEMQRALNGQTAAPSFLSLASGQDLDLLEPLDRRVADIAFAADTYRLDVSDQMPLEVGVGTFWSVGADIVRGDVTAAAGAALIEESWPS